MYFVYLYLIFVTFIYLCLSPVTANRSITYGDDKTSPSNTARVFQGATNLLPPDDETPPIQPTVPAEPEPSTSSWLGVIKDSIPARDTSLGAAHHAQPEPETSGLSTWLFGYSSKGCVVGSVKPKNDASKRSREK